MSPPAVQWCGFKKSSSVFYSMLADLIKESAPGLLHKCPYYGRVDVQNMTINVSKVLSVFNQGDYRVSVVLSEGGKTELFRLVLGLKINSAIESSFG